MDEDFNFANSLSTVNNNRNSLNQPSISPLLNQFLIQNDLQPQNISNNNNGNTSQTSSQSSSPLNFNSLTSYSCIIGRNQLVKHYSPSFSSLINSSTSINQQQQGVGSTPRSNSNSPTSTMTATSLVSNMSFFHELMKSMPELSRLEIK
jgi:hypothetical protein